MFSFEPMLLLVLIGAVAAFIIPLREQSGPFALIISFISVTTALGIFYSAWFKREKLLKVFSHRYGLTIAITVACILILFALLLLPKSWLLIFRAS